MSEHTEGRRIQSVDQAMELIEALMAAGGGKTVSEIAAESDRSIGSVHTYLATLQDHGVVVRDGNEYSLGPKLITLGEFVRNHMELYQAARDEINSLSKDTGETAHLITEHNGKQVTIYEQFGEMAKWVNRHERKRERFLEHFHCTASGKAMLAFLPEDERHELVYEHTLSEVTPQTTTDPEALTEELDEIRERGYSLNDEEQVIGMRAIGAPIRDQGGYPVGALSLSAPRHRLTGERFRTELPNRVMRAASVIEMNYASDYQ